MCTPGNMSIRILNVCSIFDTLNQFRLSGEVQHFSPASESVTKKGWVRQTIEDEIP